MKYRNNPERLIGVKDTVNVTDQNFGLTKYMKKVSTESIHGI